MAGARDRALEAIGDARRRYHRLALVVGPAGTGKTGVVRGLAAHFGAPVVNVGLELSRRLLELGERQRALGAPRLLEKIVADAGSDPALLDNTELLFDPALRQDPLRLLQGLSRRRMLVASWNGRVEGGDLRYAAPGHPEYRRYPVADTPFAMLEAEAGR